MIEPPRPNELLDPRQTHGRGDRIVLADTSLCATDESYDQLAAEAVAENEGMPARGSRASAVQRPARIRRRDCDSQRKRQRSTVEHGEGALVLLLETFDRSLERLRATPHGPGRMLHHDLEIVRDRYAEQLAALRDG